MFFATTWRFRADSNTVWAEAHANRKHMALAGNIIDFSPKHDDQMEFTTRNTSRAGNCKISCSIALCTIFRLFICQYWQERTEARAAHVQTIPMYPSHHKVSKKVHSPVAINQHHLWEERRIHRHYATPRSHPKKVEKVVKLIIRQLSQVSLGRSTFLTVSIWSQLSYSRSGNCIFTQCGEAYLFFYSVSEFSQGRSNFLEVGKLRGFSGCGWCRAKS